MEKYTVKKVGKTWGVYDGDRPVDTGFDSLRLADDRCDMLNLGHSMLWFSRSLDEPKTCVCDPLQPKVESGYRRDGFLVCSRCKGLIC